VNAKKIRAVARAPLKFVGDRSARRGRISYPRFGTDRLEWTPRPAQAVLEPSGRRVGSRSLAGAPPHLTANPAFKKNDGFLAWGRPLVK